MFIRRKTDNSSGQTYYQVVETYREDGKVKHRSVLSLGTFETPELALKSLRWRRQSLEQSLQLDRNHVNTLNMALDDPTGFWSAEVRRVGLRRLRRDLREHEREVAKAERLMVELDEMEPLLLAAIKGLKASARRRQKQKV